MNKTRRGKSPKAFLILAAVLCLILVINVITLVSGIESTRSTYTYEYSELHRELINGDYPELAKDIRRNEIAGAGTAVDTAELAAFARYYDAAVLYKAYLGTGETVKAEAQKAIMEAAQVSFRTDDVITAKEALLENLGLS